MLRRLNFKYTTIKYQLKQEYQVEIRFVLSTTTNTLAHGQKAQRSMSTIESPCPGVYVTSWVKYGNHPCLEIWNCGCLLLRLNRHSVRCRDLDFNQISGKSIDGCYTRMLRMATNISWSSHVTNEVFYGNLPKLSTKIQQRRMRLAGHIMRHETEVSNHFLLWQPDGRRKRGRRSKNYIDSLLEDTGLADINELKTLMKDRDRWK